MTEIRQNGPSKASPNKPKTAPEPPQTTPKRPATTPHASHATTHTSTAAMGWENGRHGGRAAGGRGAHFPTPWPLWRCVSWCGWREVWWRVFWGWFGVVRALFRVALGVPGGLIWQPVDFILGPSRAQIRRIGGARKCIYPQPACMRPQVDHVMRHI